MAQAQVQVKTYKNAKEYEKDAPKMAKAGWLPQGQVAQQGRVAVGRTAVKAVVFLPWAMLRPSHKADKITVTWIKS
jgi:hypothetical protein